MDTTDKQNPQSVTLTPEEEKEIDREATRFAGGNYFKNHNPVSWDDRYNSFKDAIILERLRERQRLRDAVKKINDSIWEVIDYNQDGDERDMELEFKLYAIIEAVSLLESGSGKEETNKEAK